MNAYESCVCIVGKVGFPGVLWVLGVLRGPATSKQNVICFLARNCQTKATSQLGTRAGPARICKSRRVCVHAHRYNHVPLCSPHFRSSQDGDSAGISVRKDERQSQAKSEKSSSQRTTPGAYKCQPWRNFS